MAGLTEEEKGKVAEDQVTNKGADHANKEVITKEGEQKSCVEDVREKLEEVKVGDDNGEKTAKDDKVSVEEEEEIVKEEGEVRAKESEKEEENVKIEVEPKTGVCFPVKLADGKELNSLGLRRKKVIALNINIYAFGKYIKRISLY